MHVGPEPALRRGVQRLVRGVIGAERKDVLFLGGVLVAILFIHADADAHILVRSTCACACHVTMYSCACAKLGCIPYPAGLSTIEHILARLARVAELGGVAPLRMEGGTVHGVQQANRKRPLFDQPDKGEGSQPLNGEAHIRRKRRARRTTHDAGEASVPLARDHRHRCASHLRLEAREVAVAIMAEVVVRRTCTACVCVQRQRENVLSTGDIGRSAWRQRRHTASESGL